MSLLTPIEGPVVWHGSRIDRPAHQRFCLARLRHIAGRPDYAMTEPLQPLDLLAAARVVGQMVQRDRRARAGEGLDGGKPDA